MVNIIYIYFIKKVLKTFPGPGYLRSEDRVVCLWHSLVNLYIWLTISSCYGSLPLVLGLIRRDGGLSTLCHNCGFPCQQRMLKTFPDPGYLRFEDRVVCSIHIYIYIVGGFFIQVASRVAEPIKTLDLWKLEYIGKISKLLGNILQCPH